MMSTNAVWYRHHSIYKGSKSATNPSEAAYFVLTAECTVAEPIPASLKAALLNPCTNTPITPPAKPSEGTMKFELIPNHS